MFFHTLRKYSAALLTLGLFFYGSAAVYAGGGKEPHTELTQADEMIKNKDYSGAINLLVKFVHAYPERFDEIQGRLRNIMTDMGGYTVLANKLLDMLADHPESADTILQMNRELAAMNAADGAGTEQSGGDIEQMALLTVNRRTLERILQNGRELLDKNEYAAALHEYQNGFELYQEQMYRSGYGLSVNNTVRSFLQNISAFIVSAPTMVSQFENTRRSINTMPVRAVTDNAALLTMLYSGVASSLNRLIEIKQQIFNAVRFFDEQNAALVSANDMNEGRYFFSMATLLIRGRSGEAIEEGILGSIDGIWNIAAEPLERAFGEITDNFFSQVLAMIERDNFSGAISLLSRMSNFNRNSMDLFEKWAGFERPNGAVETVMNKETASAKAREFLKYDAVDQVIRFLNNSCWEGSRYMLARTAAEVENVLSAWSRGTITTSAAISQELAWRRNYESYASAVTGIITELNVVTARYRAINIPPQPGGENERPDIDYLTRTYTALEGIRGKFVLSQINAAIIQYTITNRSMEQELSVLESNFDEETRLLSGVPSKLDDGTEITARYPREALSIAIEIARNIQPQIDSARRLLRRYQTENPVIASNSDIIALAAEARSIALRLNDLQTSNRNSDSAARSRITQADALLADARRFYNTANNALAASNFDTARDEAENSLARYNDSLEIQESVSVRNEMNSILDPLITGIAQRRYEDAVIAVRSLVNDARSEYFAGNFNNAEETLVRAETRWATISADPESEVEYWLTLVRGALFMRGGRIISPTAPLYPEMSQLLSSARKNYEEGVRLLNSNQRDAGLLMFDTAMRQSQEVRLMFPLNQAASILELQIGQLTDPSAFNQNFSQRFQTALAGIRRGSLESFADLQDLAQINPRYPGINAALVQAEIDIGIRPAPPDTRRINRSNELAAAAQRMLEANVRSQYPLVLENVNEALRLNPNNTLAMQIKDRVQVAMGGAQTADSYTEQEYLRAVRELQDGNNLLALSIVQRLLQRSENRNSVRLNELLRRIQANM
jgi:TolA-binding protein